MGVNESTLAKHASEEPSCDASLIPIEVITKQTCSECIEIIKGVHEDRPAWHIILVSIEKQSLLEQNRSDPWIKIDSYGRNVEYLCKTGKIRQASGYEIEPPEQLVKWINENYDPRAIDENISLEYTCDDIRLCTIERTRPDLSLGISLHYHRHERFHYLKLLDDDSSQVAHRAGLKSFDRIIEYRDINVEEDSAEDLKRQFEDTNNRLFKVLVCSPATYEYYRKNQKDLHNRLETVKKRKPVRDVVDVEHKYSIVPTEDTTVQITLVNTDTSVDSEDWKTVQEIDQARFVTAVESVALEMNNNKPTLANYLPKQTNILYNSKTDRKTRSGHERYSLYQQLVSLMMDNPENIANGMQIHRTQCYGCGLLRICGDRYRCLECSNYDLCGRCYEQRRQTFDHLSGHIMVHFSAPNEIFDESIVDIETNVTLEKFKEKYRFEEHREIECNHCHIKEIQGLRFKCDECHNYNLCLNCMKLRTHNKTHPLLAIGKNLCPHIPIEDIELGEELGRGGFGCVYKAKWISKDRVVACKVIDVSPSDEHRVKSFYRELNAYAEVSGIYILKIYGFNIQYLTNGTRKYMLILEYMSRGSLTHVLQQKEKIPLRRKVEMACQIASGMRKMHSHQMIHRDIRSDNILVTHDYTAKISDMGIARVQSPNDYLTRVGCQPYMPLEFYRGKYDQPLDVFTFGLTINLLFTEKKHKYDPLTHCITLGHRSPVFTELIDRCIHYDPKQRPTAIEIETTLRMYRQAIEKYIVGNKIKYGNLSTEEKNQIFITVYQEIQPDIDEILRKEFPPTESSSELVNIINKGTEILRLFGFLKPHDDQ